MTADQTTAFTPKPVTQRDGSQLQFSNCRMAAAAAGLSYDTLGLKTSTGAKMRGFADDQSGGTSSADAKQAWARGYSELLTIKDGNVWDRALVELRLGRLVHLDVWHAACGTAPGICLSGTGAYGHTIAVLPDCKGSSWLVNDPWCRPPKWARVPEAQLKAGAEAWGQRVHAEAGGPELPAEPDERIRDLLGAAARRLMQRYAPDHPEPMPQPPAETGGPIPIMFTVTAAHVPPAGGGGGSTMARFISAGAYAADSGMRINASSQARWLYLDDTDGGPFSADSSLVTFGLLDGRTGRYVIKIHTGVPYADKVARDTLVQLSTSNRPYAAPPKPPPNPDAGFEAGVKAGWNDANAALKKDVDRVLPPK